MWIDEEAARERLAEVIQRCGGVSAAARIVRMSREQIYKWSSGSARPPLFPVATLCAASGASLDWLIFGSAVRLVPILLAATPPTRGRSLPPLIAAKRAA